MDGGELLAAPAGKAAGRADWLACWLVGYSIHQSVMLYISQLCCISVGYTVHQSVILYINRLYCTSSHHPIHDGHPPTQVEYGTEYRVMPASIPPPR